MNQSNRFKYGSFLLPTLFFIPITFYSCDVYNFSSPQPIDKENIYEFPEGFRGTWESEGTSYLLTRKYALVISRDTEEIANGAWPKLNERGEYLNSDFQESFQTIYYDSLKRPIDTSDNYVLKAPLIYEKDERGDLGKGYSYVSKHDRIIIFKIDTLCIDLGQNAFLRQIDNNTYVLNIHNTNLGSDVSYNENWWQVILLEKKNDKSIDRREYSPKITGLACMFHTRPLSKESDVYYFDCHWTRADMLRMMREGYFEPGSELRPTY